VNPSDLKREYEKRHHGLFFDRKTMQFFGDTLKNYGVRDAGDRWELFRKKPVKFGIQASRFFDKKTFERVYE